MHDTHSARSFLRDCGLQEPITVWIEPRKVCSVEQAQYPVEATAHLRYQTLLFGWKAVQDFLTFDPIAHVLYRTLAGFPDFDTSDPIEVITYTANEYYFWEFMARYVKSIQETEKDARAVWPT